LNTYQGCPLDDCTATFECIDLLAGVFPCSLGHGNKHMCDDKPNGFMPMCAWNDETDECD
jgi:hypothetical protein